MNWIEEIENYIPYNKQEEVDKKTILSFCDENEDALYRENTRGHMTSTGFVINETHTKVLMAFHNIYQSYSWTGGHNDGVSDFAYVAEKEVKEETGLNNVRRISEIISLDDLPVDTHMKKGKKVNAHRHYNITYLFEADENEEVHIKADENSALKWIPLIDMGKWVSEEIMMVVYNKIVERIEKQDYVQSK